LFGAEFFDFGFGMMEKARRIEVEFESTESDFQRVLLRYHWKRMFLEYALMIALGIPVCYFLGIDFLDIENSVWAAFAFFATLTALLILDLYRRVVLQAKKLTKITQPAKTIFSEKGVASETATASSSRDWANYLKIDETGTDFIFFTQENFFATIPKRFFKDQKEIVSLRELIKDKLGDKARLQK
jgi:hypothetical protein